MSVMDLTLYGITDRGCLNGISMDEAVIAALEGGASMIQLREKNMPLDELIAEAIEIKKICHRYNVPLLINDNVEACIRSDADGVHLGQNDMSADEARKLLGSSKIIGVTAKTVEQAQKAEAMGADYLGSGAIFGTSTKADAKKMSFETLKSITSSVSIPVVAIGGINSENIHLLKDSGISGAAVVSGIFGQADISDAAARLRRIMEEIL